MTSIITIAEHELEAGWTWVKHEAAGIYGDLKPVVEAALKAFEAAVVPKLWGALAAFVGKLSGVRSLADIETAFLNTIELLGGSLLTAAVALGSTLLQSLLGVLSHKAGTAVA